MAQKSGNLASGDFMVERMIKRGSVPLLFVASDVAENNLKKYNQLSETYHIPTCKLMTKEELGRAIGKERRVVIAVKDAGFAKALLKIIDE